MRTESRGCISIDDKVSAVISYRIFAVISDGYFICRSSCLLLHIEDFAS